MTARDAERGTPASVERSTPASVVADDRLMALVDALVVETGATRNTDLVKAMVESTMQLARDGADRLDLKLARSALAEMADAFRMFAPYKDIRKVTIFGSARTAPSDALYDRTRELARRFAEAGWMVITGAGPGIMAAGNEGAGREMAIGVNIRLPFEAQPNAWIADDEKLVEMKYFFTRKLMLIKESSGFLVLPGGFGTLDECFELLTLLQTGKAEPAPIALVEPPGDRYWEGWERFVTEQVFSRGLADCLVDVVGDQVERGVERVGEAAGVDLAGDEVLPALPVARPGRLDEGNRGGLGLAGLQQGEQLEALVEGAEPAGQDEEARGFLH
ncbi:MAG TPA: TIGR00730 family Rossman fold protein, partial [Acidimicrobiales bacterium]|nr:TIGR00730 family Rossman fold protein [Acidimicrobiales bacterium]